MGAGTEVGFYHLTRSALEPALGRLLERVLESGLRAVVRASSAERAEALNRALWQFGRDSFLPHGTRADGSAEDQPVFLTDREDYPNGARCWCWSTAPRPIRRAFRRCLYLFDGNDEPAVERARDLWRRWRERGMALTYWQQTERGWQKAAPAGPEPLSAPDRRTIPFDPRRGGRYKQARHHQEGHHGHRAHALDHQARRHPAQSDRPDQRAPRGSRACGSWRSGGSACRAPRRRRSTRCTGSGRSSRACAPS